MVQLEILKSQMELCKIFRKILLHVPIKLFHMVVYFVKKKNETFFMTIRFYTGSVIMCQRSMLDFYSFILILIEMFLHTAGGITIISCLLKTYG